MVGAHQVGTLTDDGTRVARTVAADLRLVYARGAPILPCAAADTADGGAVHIARPVRREVADPHLAGVSTTPLYHCIAYITVPAPGRRRAERRWVELYLILSPLCFMLGGGGSSEKGG